jgi:hypothetical protein
LPELIEPIGAFVLASDFGSGSFVSGFLECRFPLTASLSEFVFGHFQSGKVPLFTLGLFLGLHLIELVLSAGAVPFDLLSPLAALLIALEDLLVLSLVDGLVLLGDLVVDPLDLRFCVGVHTDGLGPNCGHQSR